MKLFGNKKEPIRGSSIPRISKMSEYDLISWMDASIMHLGSAYDTWRDHDELPEEVDRCLEALNEVWAEIKARQNGRSSS